MNNRARNMLKAFLSANKKVYVVPAIESIIYIPYNDEKVIKIWYEDSVYRMITESIKQNEEN